jgi:pimeloyl-ACP methyl ester carboxylesterase
MARRMCRFRFGQAAILVISILIARTSAERIPKRLVTEDNWPITISYYPSAEGKESPVVVFLHGEGEHRGYWEVEDKNWPEDLQKKGIACLTVDLRKQGESKPPGTGSLKLTAADYRAMVTSDMSAVKEFIHEEHQAQRLNMRKMSIVASQESCSVALIFAAIDWAKKPWPDSALFSARTPRGQDVRSLVLISPRKKVPGLSIGDAVKSLRQQEKDLAILTLSSVDDPEDKGFTDGVYQTFKSAEQRPRVFKLELNGDSRGIEMAVQDSRAASVFSNFIDKYLVEREGEWVDRKAPGIPRFD